MPRRKLPRRHGRGLGGMDRHDGMPCVQVRHERVEGGVSQVGAARVCGNLHAKRALQSKGAACLRNGGRDIRQRQHRRKSARRVAACAQGGHVVVQRTANLRGSGVVTPVDVGRRYREEREANVCALCEGARVQLVPRRRGEAVLAHGVDARAGERVQVCRGQHVLMDVEQPRKPLRGRVRAAAIAGWHRDIPPRCSGARAAGLCPQIHAPGTLPRIEPVACQEERVLVVEEVVCHVTTLPSRLCLHTTTIARCRAAHVARPYPYGRCMARKKTCIFTYGFGRLQWRSHNSYPNMGGTS